MTNSAQPAVDPVRALALVAAFPDERSGAYVTLFRDEFACSLRAAKDTLGIFRTAGYLAGRTDEHDRRGVRFTLSERGRRVLEQRAGRGVLEVARTLFTTCGSRPQGSLEERLEALLRYEALFLSGLPPTDLFVSEQLGPVKVEGLPEVVVDPLEQPLEQFVQQPRCKVCRSPYRDQIDLLLAAGRRQSEVRRKINDLLGSDYFTRNNISYHARNHATEHNDELRTLLQARVDQRRQNEQLVWEKRNLLLSYGLSALAAGTLKPTTSDLLRVLRDKADSERSAAEGQALLATLVTQFTEFVAALKEIADEESFQRLLDNYAQRYRAKLQQQNASERRALLSGASAGS